MKVLHIDASTLIETLPGESSASVLRRDHCKRCASLLIENLKCSISITGWLLKTNMQTTGKRSMCLGGRCLEEDDLVVFTGASQHRN
jgi:hypothetical protein